MLRQSRFLRSVISNQIHGQSRVLASATRAFHLPRDEAYKMSITDPTKFWGLQAAKLDWFKPFDSVLTMESNGYGRWFRGGSLNTCYNALDRHVHRGNGDRTAIIYDSPVTNTIEHISYKSLLDQVVQLAAYLRSQNVQKGDRVVIYMPNIPQAGVAMLACARIGAVHSVVFGGFAAHELAVRIKDCQPKVVLSSSCGIDGSKLVDYKTLLDQALDIVRESSADRKTSSVTRCVILQRPQQPCQLVEGRDVAWNEALAAVDKSKASQLAQCAHMDSEDPLYVLYTSGTTGAPKGVQRDTAGHAVALAYSMEAIYNIRPGDVMWAASDVGWVVGHTYGLYGPLLVGATSVMFEGKPIGTPDAGAYWRVIAQHKVRAFFTAPTAIRAMKRVDSEGKIPSQYDLSNLSALHLAGEHADRDTLHWLENATRSFNGGRGIPVRDHWWQTESGWPICADVLDTTPHPDKRPAHLVEETVYGSCYRPVPGYDLRLFNQDSGAEIPLSTKSAKNTSTGANDSAHDVEEAKQGHIFIKLPLPPGALYSLYQAPERFQSSYLSNKPGYYDTGDAGYRDSEGRVFVMARTDDVLNVAGHRLSSGALEEAVCLHPDVAEAAVVGVKDNFKGQVPLGLVVLNASAASRNFEDVEKEIVALVRERIGPVAAFKNIAVVARLPKTRSGKTLRATLRQMANNEAVKVPATVEDVSVIDEVHAIIKRYISLHSHEVERQ